MQIIEPAKFMLSNQPCLLLFFSRIVSKIHFVFFLR